MYLKSLVLKGFKSFADRSMLVFEPGITAVVGPNGSGKSNISDAVLWVLGELNAKNLRGQAMEDVIFAGSSARAAVGVAEVELVLDNSDGTLPVDYTEVSIGRRMYRSGESEYLINGAIVRRMDVLDILHDSGLGTGTHSIIAQGHLANILASKPEDRRALIEEAAGVLKHKQRKAKSERKLQRMDDHLARVQDVVAEVERQLRPLERKAKHALAYREAAGELEDLTLQLAVDDLRILQGKWDEALKQEEAARARLALLREDISRAEAEAEGLQRRLAEETASSQSAAQLHRRAQGASDRLDSNVLLLHEKRRSLASYLADARLRLQDDERRAQEMAEALVAAQAALDAAARERDAADAALEAARARTDALQSRKRELQGRVDDASRRRRDAASELEGVRAAQARTREILASNRAREKMIGEREAELAERLESAQSAFDEAVRAARTADALAQETQEREAAAREAQGAAVAARDEARSRLDAARDRRAAASAQMKSLEELERSRGALNPLRAWMLTDWQGEATPLLDEITAEAEVEMLVELLLDHDVEDLFVPDAASAASAIRSLAGGSLEGSLSLLPRASMRAPSAPAAGSRLIDRVTCSAAAAPALEALLGDVVLCDTVEQAQRAAAGGSVGATLDGVVVRPNGKASLVRKASDASQGALATHRALEEARGALRSADRALAQARDEAAAAEGHLRACQTATLAASQERAQARGGQSSARAERQRAAAALESAQGEAKRIAGQRAAAQEALAKAEPEAATLDERAFSLSAAISEAKDEFDRLRDELAPIRARSDEASNALAEAKLAAATCKEKCDYAVRMKLARERDVKSAREAGAAVRGSIHLKSAASDRIAPLLEACESLADAARARTVRLEERSAASRSASGALHDEIARARVAAKRAHEAFDEANESLGAARVEKGKLELQVEAAIHAITDECRAPLETALKLPELEDRPAVEGAAFKLKRRIANMGAINPDAAAEYAQLKERYDYLRSQVDDMLSARRSVRRIMAVIDERMRDDFVDTFESVNESFKRIFARLFPGGKGSLTMVDPADPENTGVEVNAQPNGKRITKMSLMSGGEKSLVAMALLFAVYETRSTPFYILDEVEAALDDTNLRRLTAYLDSIRRDTQFIMITHQRRTMEMADVLYGISMQNDGVTKVMSQRLERALAHAEG
ncbi:chromosome segregation protein SMC [Curtanaerobium respiraculi]|uniref:chromosome segregation protein SMC n=1 Tax=Curtanaerobium respiraculi TaxID=2949669 RepID=UPI0024B3A805|nr:chromosome segregation protein SMC [Curtanaerobium respiraculi]